MTDPQTVLGRIVARKRVDVAARLGAAALDALIARAVPTRRSLRAALARPGARFVMEVKRASPSGGALRAGADPAALARAYAGAADAISVLTDTPYFGGSLDDLAAVRAAFDGPVLAKDFVIDPRQVAEARLHGADAVLAMLSVLDDAEARAVIAVADRLGMDVLVEAHDEAELARAVGLGAPLIGINNRDLKTLTVDLATTERLAAHVPADRILVSESGITRRADVRRLAPLVDAFLVGSALMTADSPAIAARHLAFGPVKVCGLTCEADARDAIGRGAALAGLVMVPGTPRAVTLDRARPIAAAARAAGGGVVGVFRNERVDQVAASAGALDLDAVQLHGAEDGAYIKALRAMLPSRTEIWAAIPSDGPSRRARPGADRALYDTGAGGTGRPFDWSRVADEPDLPRAFLAGGLTPANAAAAARLGAFGLDVGSGVEAAPGRKDPEKLAAFFAALRPESRAC